MNTTFSTQVRILLCGNCGAPLEALVAGGQTSCRYCNGVSQLGGRDDRPLFAPMDGQRRLSEPERIARLRTQDGRPLLPPPSIASLVPNGKVEPWKVQEALAVWQSTRQELRGSASYEAAERLLFLTMVLANDLSEKGDFMRQRAMFESALEVFALPRHRQIIRGYLSRSAAKMNDLAAAEQWLAPCDPASDELDSDSAYRFSRAFIDTTRGDFNAVLRALGGRNEDVPIMDAMDPACSVLRANAWEKLGNLPAAIDVLSGAMRSGPQSRMTLERVIHLNPAMQLCPQSFKQAEMQHSAAAGKVAAIAATGGVHKVFVPLGGVILALGVVCLVLGILEAILDIGVGPAPIALSATFVPLGGIFLAVGLMLSKAAARAERIRVHGIAGTGRVVSVAPTGISINNVPQLRYQLQIELPGRAPYQTSAKMLGSAGIAHGAQVPVRVDPDDPSEVLIELQ